MKKIFIIFAVLSLMFSTMATAIEISHCNKTIYASGPNGPAPNSGDGIPDGSGFDPPFGPNKGK